MAELVMYPKTTRISGFTCSIMCRNWLKASWTRFFINFWLAFTPFLVDFKYPKIGFQVHICTCSVTNACLVSFLAQVSGQNSFLWRIRQHQKKKICYLIYLYAILTVFFLTIYIVQERPKFHSYDFRSSNWPVQF